MLKKLFVNKRVGLYLASAYILAMYVWYYIAWGGQFARYLKTVLVAQ